MIRVMIVDDQRILLEGLLHLFEKTGKIEVVKILQLSEVAEVAAQVLQPDIILMDICMEGRTSGIEVTRRIKKSTSPAENHHHDRLRRRPLRGNGPRGRRRQLHLQRKQRRRLRGHHGTHP